MMKKKRQQGFTLIELVIALGITVMIGIMSYISLDAISTASRGAQENLERLDFVDQTFELIASDLFHLTPRSIDGVDGEKQPAFFGGNDYGVLLRFSRSGKALASDENITGQERIAYRLHDNQLWRDRWQYISEQEEFQGTLMLLDNIEEIQWRFQALTGDDQWSLEWPANNETKGLPGVVELTLTLEDMGEISRLFLLPAGE